MQQLRIKKQVSLVFRQWNNRSYSVFASLGKLVFIAVLPVTYSLISAPCKAQSNSTGSYATSPDTLPEVEVVPDDVAIPVFPSRIIEFSQIVFASSDRSEQAEWLPGFDVRSRGGNGVQGDIQLRGGSPEQTVVMLNGIPMNDMQTGHNTLNLPVPDICIGKITGYSGAESLFFVPGAYNGAVNYSCRNLPENYIAMHLTGGSFFLMGYEAMAGFSTRKLHHLIACSSKQSKGYMFNTDFNTEKAYYMISAQLPISGYFRFQAGVASKDFGAQSFYSTRFPNQYESIRTGFVSLQASAGLKFNFVPAIYWKRSHDRFELFRESFYTHEDGYYIWGTDTAKYSENSYVPTAYYQRHNYHLSDRIGISLTVNRGVEYGTFSANCSYNHDRIVSTVLGEQLEEPKNDPFSTGIELAFGKTRNMANLFAGFNSKSFSGFSFQAGAMGFWFGTGIKPGGGLKLSYSYTQTFSAWLSFNRNQRLPTYTELYYKSVTNIGNSNLHPEDAYNYELGFAVAKNWFHAEEKLFYIDGLNTIDWVRAPDETVYHAMNHTHITTIGNTLTLAFKPLPDTKGIQWLKSFSVSHTYLKKTKFSSELLSAYTLDYLRHKLNANVIIGFGQIVEAEIRISYQTRNGTYTLNNTEVPYQPVFATDVGISSNFGKLTVYVLANNIFNAQTPDFGGIIPSGCWLSAGIKINTGNKSKIVKK